MVRVFDVDALADVPGPGRRTLALTARVDIDMATEAAARAQITAPDPGPPDGLLLDFTGVFVGVAAIRCIRDAAEHASALAVVGAPRWLPGLTTLFGGAAPPFVRTVPEAVEVLRAMECAALPVRSRTVTHS